MAAGGGHSKIVKILLENGANPEDENAVQISIFLNPNRLLIVIKVTDPLCEP